MNIQSKEIIETEYELEPLILQSNPVGWDYWKADTLDLNERNVLLSSNPKLPKNLADSFKDDLSLPSETEFWNIKELTLTKAELMEGLELLNKNIDIFSKDEYDLGYFHRWKHTIDTGTNPPIRNKPRKLSQSKLEALKGILEGLEKGNQIRPSRSDWAACIVMVPKTDGSWRMCMDYRPLNLLASCCQYPLPRITDILCELRGACYFTALDLAKGFHQIPLDETSIPKTAFVTPLGQYEYLTVPMGLHSAPAAFQSAMQQVLTGCSHFALVYIDDIIIYSKTFAEHLNHVREVFKRLRIDNLKVNPVKCEFFRTELAYLGHVINALGIHTDPKKVSAVQDMPEPICIADVETFVGKIGYYQKFIDHYSTIAFPLLQMKRKNAKFIFGETERKAFNQLKEALCTSPVLKHPDFTRPFCIAADASGYGLGAVLFQKYGTDNQDEHPVAYASRTLKSAELRYAVIEREALAAYWACKQFYEYIDDREVTIYTDHKALIALNYKQINNHRIENLIHKLSEFKYTFEYRPGKDNANADALSRYPILPCKGHRSKEIQTNESDVNEFDPLSKLATEVPKFKKIPLEPKVKPKVTQKEISLEIESPPVAHVDAVTRQVEKEPITPVYTPVVPRIVRYPIKRQEPPPDVPIVPIVPIDDPDDDEPLDDPMDENEFELDNDPSPEPEDEPIIDPEDERVQSLQMLKNMKYLQEQVPQYQAIIQYLTCAPVINFAALSFELLRTLEQFYLDDDKILNRLTKDGDGVLCLPPSLYPMALYDSHSAPVVGHYGIAKTLYRVQEDYFWPGMSKNVADYIQKCPICQAYKLLPRIPREKLGDRPPPKDTWERVHMDIWSPGGYSNSGNRYVIAFVDVFSKFVIFVPIPNQTSEVIIEVIINHVFMPYGSPDELVSDSAANFLNALQRDLARIFGINRRVTTPYRPQANGQVERIFKTIRPILAALAKHAPKNWDKYLAMAANSYNTAYHAGINSTPFKIMYGRTPTPLSRNHANATELTNYSRIKKWAWAIHHAQKGLLETQQRSKTYYDKKRAHPQKIVIGNSILIRVPKVPRESIHKLYPKYVGPYKIIKIIGSILHIIPHHGKRVPSCGYFRIHKDRVRVVNKNYPNIHTQSDLLIPFKVDLQDPKLDAEIIDL